MRPINKSEGLAHYDGADQNSAHQIGAMKTDQQAPKSEIAAMLGFRDTGTEAALRLGLADVGVRFFERTGTKDLGEKK